RRRLKPDTTPHPFGVAPVPSPRGNSEQLAANLSARELLRMHVDVDGLVADRGQELGELAWSDALRRGPDHVGHVDGAADLPGRLRARLRSRWAVAEVAAQKHADTAGRVMRAEVQVRLRDVRHAVVRERVLDRARVLVDDRAEE